MKNLLLILTFVSLFLISCQDDDIHNVPATSNNIENFDIVEPNIEIAYPESQGKLIKLNKSSKLPITVEKFDNEYIWTGDIILTEDQLQILSNSDSEQNRTALANLASRWPNCTVYYAISSSLPNQSRVTDAIAHWKSQHPDLKFIQRTNQSNYIEFVPSTGCSSSLGMTGGRQEIRLASGCTTGNTIHEIGHALGLLHEQQRADRSNSIIINWSNIISGTEHNFETYSQRGINGFEIGSFDFNSIMLYGSYAFSANNQPTITKLDGSTFTGQRSGLSTGDLEIIELMYDCSSFSVRIEGPSKGDNQGSYTWNANIVSDGTPPYTYKWYGKYSSYPYSLYGTGPSLTSSLPLDENLDLKLEVTDATGSTVVETRTIINMPPIRP